MEEERFSQQEERGLGASWKRRKEMGSLGSTERKRSLESPKEEEEWRVARLGSSF